MRLIDADALIDDIKNNLWDWETVDGITATTVLKQTISDIGNQPIIEERKTGKWLPDCEYDGEDEWCFYTCSCCEYQSDDQFKYCPSCGADMREQP